MKLSIMQPYFFPYIGYFQLYYASDRFIFLNDVNFQKKSYVHKNHIGDSSKKIKIQIPVAGASQNKKILDLRPSDHHDWRKKLLYTLSYVYRRAPNFIAVMNLVERSISADSIAQIAMNSVIETAGYLELEREAGLSSDVGLPSDTTGRDRIIELCKEHKATEYINMYGGQALYRQKDFAEIGIQIRFLVPVLSTYKRSRGSFIPSLSIIDALMHESPKAVKKMAAAGCLTGRDLLGAIN